MTTEVKKEAPSILSRFKDPMLWIVIIGFMMTVNSDMRDLEHLTARVDVNEDRQGKKITVLNEVIENQKDQEIEALKREIVNMGEHHRLELILTKQQGEMDAMKVEIKYLHK